MARFKTLITANQLLMLLLEDIRSYDWTHYIELHNTKNIANYSIKEKPSDYWKERLLSNVLPKQKEMIIFYVKHMPRLERIIEILQKREKTISKDRQNLYKIVRELLIQIIRAAPEYIQILERQEHALRHNDFKTYLKWVKVEQRLHKKVVKPLMGLKIKDISRVLGNKTISDNLFMAIVAGMLLLFVGIVGFNTATRYVPSVARICVDVGMRLNGKIMPIEEMKQKYINNDLLHELHEETELEALIGVPIYGNYSPDDIKLAKFFFERTFGPNLKQYAIIDSFFFMPSDAQFAPIYKSNPICLLNTERRTQGYFISHAAGLAEIESNGIIVLSQASLKDLDQPVQIQFIRMLAHEITHRIHFSLKNKPQFEAEWEAIKGGYPTRYAIVDLKEGVAEVAATVFTSVVMDKPDLMYPHEDNNTAAYWQKVRLLQRYGFFPPSIAAHIPR